MKRIFRKRSTQGLIEMRLSTAFNRSHVNTFYAFEPATVLDEAGYSSVMDEDPLFYSRLLQSHSFSQ